MILGMVTTATVAAEPDTGSTDATVQETTVEAPAEEQEEPVVEESYDEEEPVEEQWEESAEQAESAEAEEPAQEEEYEEPAEEQEADLTDVEDEDEAAVIETTEEQQETAVTYPALNVKDKARVKDSNNQETTVTVTVDAPEGAFPEGTRMILTPVRENDTLENSDKTVLEAVQETTDKEIVNVVAVDITFEDMEGNKVEPLVPISVSLKSEKLAADNAAVEDLSIVHIDDQGEPEELKEAEINQDSKTAEFESDAFSVYAIVETGSTDEGARVAVNFYAKDHSKPIATYYVKDKDTLAELEYIVVDPSIGELESNEIFRGWSIDREESDSDGPAYTEDTEAEDIVAIRNYLLNLEIKEGDVVNIYGLIFKYYNVTYYGESQGISLGTDTVVLKPDEDHVSYTVNMAYTPGSGDQDFEGWLVSEGKNNIEGYTEGQMYRNNTDITISGDVVFSVYAPRGQWLIFHEEGGTYVAPQFIKTEETTREPAVTMRKLGYTFDGWYTAAGEEFTFGNPLLDRTEIYARWTPNTTADYVVIIWKQNVNDNKNAADSAKTYDFAESVKLTGNVGAAITAVTASGTGNNRYASVNGTAKRYPGFHLRTYDTGKTVNAEGNQVINVYYDRNLVTLTFRYYGGLFSGWQTQATMTGLYGSSLASNGYTWPTNRWWYDSYDSILGVPIGVDGTRTTFLDAFKLSDDASSQTYYGFAGAGNIPINFYKEDPDNAGTFTLTNEVTSAAGTFYISDKYNGYKAVSYSKNGTQWTPLGDKDSDGYYASVSDYTQLHIRYSPLKYSILYKDGVYVDGKGNTLNVTGAGQWKTVSDIIYGSHIDSYNKEGANYFDPSADPETAGRVKDGFVFEGWYIDDQCLHPYTFTTMPEGITVYAKWRQVEYRVFLHPNVDSSDTSLDWGVTDQQMSFLRPYGEKASLPTGTRNNFEFIAWYRDEARTQLFDPDLITLTETTVTTDYDRTQPTELNKYGIPISNENKDAANNRYWVNKKLDLYAKWRATLIGANGIGIIYDAVDGTNEPHDNLLYLDQAGAVAQAASTAPEGKVFFYWVVQKWNGTAFEDTSVKVYPGDTFTVLKDNAREQDITDGSATEDVYKTFTIQLRAEYGEPEVEKPTHITWYGNGGTNARKIADKDGEITNAGDTVTYINLQINQHIDAAGEDTFTRAGFKFIGWARETEPAGAFNEESHTVDASKYSEKTNLKLWLKLNEDGTYTEMASDGVTPTGNTSVTEIAADEKAPYHALYAVWEQRDTFTVYHTGRDSTDEGVIETYYVDEYTDKTFDLTGNLTSGTLYGGYYLENGFTAPADGKKYDGSNWTFTDPETANGTAITPVKDTTYYIKEVPDTYLRPVQFETYNYFSKIETDFYLISTVDDSNYQKTGFTISGEGDIEADVYNKVNLKYANHAAPGEATQDYKETLDVTDFSDNKSGLVTAYQETDFIKAQGNSIIFRAFFVTPDNVKVTGAVMRKTVTASNAESVDDNGQPVVKFGDVTAKDYKVTSLRTVLSPASDGNGKKLEVSRNLSLSVPDDAEELPSEDEGEAMPQPATYTIKKCYGSTSMMQDVEEGNQTGKIGYLDREGSVFAGWYLDETYTTPASFVNVTADMTVYARYIKTSDIEVSASKNGKNKIKFVIDVPENIYAGTNVSFKLGTEKGEANLDSVKKVNSGWGKNKKSLTEYSGTVTVKNISTGRVLTVMPEWTTQDGTTVKGSSYSFTYILGLFF